MAATATACVLQSIPPSTALLYRPRPNQISLPRRLRICKNSSNEDAPPSPVAAPGPEPVRIRFRGVSKKRRRKMMEEEESESQLTVKEQAPPKKWEEMTLSEKALELYVGEKGLLFWLNKFAYASIYIVIGAWILFRFVGPALNLYQLDAPPMPPTKMLKGS